MLQLLRLKKRQASDESEAASNEGASDVVPLLLKQRALSPTEPSRLADSGSQACTEASNLIRLLRPQPPNTKAVSKHADQLARAEPITKRCCRRESEAADLIQLLVNSSTAENDSSQEDEDEATLTIDWEKMKKFAEIHVWEKAEAKQVMTKPKRAYKMVNRNARDNTSQRLPFKENGTSAKRISGLLCSDCHCSRAAFKILVHTKRWQVSISHVSVPVVSVLKGASRKCYQILGSREEELHRFLQEFWAMPKRDQDNLAAYLQGNQFRYQS